MKKCHGAERGLLRSAFARGVIWASLLGATTAAAQTARASVALLPNADPFITTEPVNGAYLLLATTGRNITIWSGPTVPRAAVQSAVVFSPTDGLEQLWSPTIWQRGGRWWIYFTAQMPGKEHAIYVLQSDTGDPLGRYTFRGALDLGRPSIDPSILTVKGKDYLMYVTVDGGENAIRMVRLAGPMQPVGDSSLIAEPQYGWEKGEGTSRNYPVDEGPTALYHGGKTFVVFSGSDTASPRYCLGLLTLTGEDPLQRSSWTKGPKPVFEANAAADVYGPGRGTFARGKDAIWWLLYASRTTDAPTAAGRATTAQPFQWKADGSPDFGIPLHSQR